MLLGEGHNECVFPLLLLALGNKVLLEILVLPDCWVTFS